MLEQEQICDRGEPLHIGVTVQDEQDEGVPGVTVWLTWAEGTDRAVTGLKPDKGLGYADFNVNLETRYTISVGELAMPILSGLQVEKCPSRTRREEPIFGSWHIVLGPET